MGALAWGGYSLVLRDQLIAHRTTVFEENVYNFCARHKIVAGDAAPPGFRATWANRERLAVAKLHSRLSPSTVEKDFPGIMLTQGTSTGDAEFIEVHVFGPVNRAANEKVTGPKPQERADLSLWKSIAKKLKSAGIPFEEIS